MNLLIITQKVDKKDPILGFFHRWVLEFAKHCENVIVICLQKGDYDLPENVKVLSLGKELAGKGLTSRNEVEGGETLRRQAGLCGKRSFLARGKYICIFYKYIWKERKNYDAVFVHMNPIYIILGGCLWALWRKKISLWYTHKKVDIKLHIAEKIVDIIFTASFKSFRLRSKKVRIMGHGIDIENFKPVVKERSNVFRIVTIGRISPVKDYDTLIMATEILNKNDLKIKIDIIGGGGMSEQENYLNSLKKLIFKKGLDDIINFVGPVSSEDIPKYLQSYDLFVNMSHTGSLDKAILEAMSAGIPIITCNEAAGEILDNYKDILIFKKSDAYDLARKIEHIASLSIEKRDEAGMFLREIVVKNHNIVKLIKDIVNNLK